MSAYAHEYMALDAGDRRLRSVRAMVAASQPLVYSPKENGNTNARSAVTPTEWRN